MQKTVFVYTDGASRGNPGPGAAAYVLTDSNQKIIGGKGVFIGSVTNNIAEYTALLYGLKATVALGAKIVMVRMDSELAVKQINGEYRVKNPELRRLYQMCIELLNEFSEWEVRHISRQQNTQADDLANHAIDMKGEVVLKTKKDVPKGKAIRLAVLISGGGRTMLNIQKQITNGNLNAEIVVVISSRSAIKGVERARESGLDVRILRTKDFDGVEEFSEAIAQVLEETRVNLVVQAGWLCLWRIPTAYENRVMNIHPALLPSFGGQGMWGQNVHEAVLRAGCKLSGCTVHFCTNEYDKGPIIVQRCCEVKSDDNTDSLAARVFEQECIAYPQAISLFSEGKLSIEDGLVKVKP